MEVMPFDFFLQRVILRRLVSSLGHQQLASSKSGKQQLSGKTNSHTSLSNNKKYFNDVHDTAKN
jgi:hypothetical protein